MEREGSNKGNWALFQFNALQEKVLDHPQRVCNITDVHPKLHNTLKILHSFLHFLVSRLLGLVSGVTGLVWCTGLNQLDLMQTS